MTSPQVPNNLVLGTPDTNTVMMRQGHLQMSLAYKYNSLTFSRFEAFVKRLAYYSNDEEHALVLVKTDIYYPGLSGWDHDWIGEAKYTWLAPRLFYCYSNDKKDKPVSKRPRGIITLRSAKISDSMSWPPGIYTL